MRFDLPFTGVASFCKAPLCTDWRDLDTDVAILGVPFDMSTQVRAGARSGPRAIREASTMYSLGPDGFYDDELGVYRMQGVRLTDCGDVDMSHMDPHLCLENTFDALSELVAKDVLPVMLGGDHAITAAIVRAFHGRGPLHVVSFDSHLDFVDVKHGVRHAQNNPMRRISEMGHVSRMAIIGVNGLGSSRREDYAAARDYGAVVVGARELRRIGPEEAVACIPKGARCYVTIDVDCLSAALAPGTGVPSPGGMEYYALVDMLRAIAGRVDVVGFDVVEVAPMYDPTGVTSQVAADVIVDFVSSIFLSRNAGAAA